ncbi:MAG: InlB B-repeat-containing protein [Lachnospiraceae bacterium]|nr:InlB B-repeat-containing protein [Lachnospiraceae bacterium]
MNNNPWVKKNIIKNLLAALVIVGLLVNMEGVQGIGTLRARADVSFPDRVVANGSIIYTPDSVDVTKCDGCYVVFCDSEKKAEQALNSVSDKSQIGNLGNYGKVEREEQDYDVDNPFACFISVPSVINYGSGVYSVDAWVQKDNKKVFDSDYNRYCYVAAYVAEFSVGVWYLPGDGAEGDTVRDNSSSMVFEDSTTPISITLRSADTFTREGYELVGWKSDFGDNETGTPGENFDLYLYGPYIVSFTAQWEEIPTVTVTYRPNGGTGSAVNKTIEFETDAGGDFGTIDLLSSADFTREGYTLAGWKITEPEKTDGKEEYDLGDECTFSANSETLVFDAVWTAKKAGKVEIDVKKPVYVGAKFKYDTDKNSDGDVTLEYKKKGAKDDDYTKKVPTEPGTYTVRATLEETDEYTSAEDTADFELQYLSAPASPFTYTEIKNSAGTVTDLNVVPAVGYSIGVSGKADDTFGASVLYSTAKKAGGVYLKRDNDGAITELVQLTAYTAKDEPKITVAPSAAATGKIYYGTKFSVTATSFSPAEKTITYKKTEAGGTYSAAVPTEPGKYTVRLTAPATDFYAAVDETAEFTIDYLGAPSTGVSLQGTKGKGTWYTSDVKLAAPTGYLISVSPNGTFKESIDWDENITEIYYQRKSDLARTDAVKVSFDVKIDKDEPAVVFDSSLGISGKEKSITVYADTLTFKIKDKNLKTVKINNDVHILSGEGEYTVLLTSGLLSETNTIIATDEAGNEYTMEIVLAPAWRQSREIPMGREVRLVIGEAYKLNSKCKLDGNTGDDTVYEKNVTVYVRKEETYSFVEVQGE